MAATCGRVESAAVVPGGGWSVAVNDGVAYNASLVAAVVYSGPTAVMAALVASLNAAALAAGSARTWIGSIANGEAGTGYATLTISAGANVTLTWTTTTLRDLLGWSANLAGAITYTSPAGVLGMWLPDCPISQPFPLGEVGDIEANISSTVSPLGVVKTILTTSRTRHPGITWTNVALARARQASEASGVRSFERFVRDCMIGSTGLAYFRAGGDLTIWWNAGAGTSQQYNSPPPRSVREVLEPATPEGWMGLWRCKWPGGYV
jgi:hypothetical protein